MNEIQKQQNNMPATIPELSKFVLIGREKLNAVRAQIRVIDKVSLAAEVRAQKLREAQELGEAVLDAEVRLGELFSGLEKKPGVRTDLKPGASADKRSKKEIIESAGFSVQAARRYEILYQHQDAVEQAKISARNNGEIVNRTTILEEIAAHRKPYIINNSGTAEWYTPSRYIESARQVMGTIDLDPCSSEQANRTVRAERYYTIADDGLKQEWAGNVWLNPPYSEAGKFIDKLLVSPKVNQTIVLVNNATETAWFKKLSEKASAIVFHTGRLRFVNPESDALTPPMQGQAFLYVGPASDCFLSEFLSYGWGTRLVK